jgi:hypothetical protein
MAFWVSPAVNSADHSTQHASRTGAAQYQQEERAVRTCAGLVVAAVAGRVARLHEILTRIQSHKCGAWALMSTGVRAARRTAQAAPEQVTLTNGHAELGQ